MGCRVLYDQEEDMAVLYDSVTMTSFGPVFSGPLGKDEAEAFLVWYEDEYGSDVRKLSAEEVIVMVDKWRDTLPEDDPELACGECGAGAYEACDESVAEHVRG